MAQTAYRDGAAHELEELEAECARLLEEDEAAEAGSTELNEELAELRLRVRAPITSSVDAAERRTDLARYDTALETSRVALGLRRSRRRVRVVLLSIVSLIVVSGAASIASARKTRPEGSCRTHWRCAEQGRCVPALTTLVGVTTPDEPEGCVARARSHCSRACDQHGLCGVSDGACVATSDDDCANSEACYWHGRCAREGDMCVPKQQAHCIDSVDCAWRDQCSLSENTCVRRRPSR